MANSAGGNRTGLLLVLAVVFTLVVADWFFGTLTRDLLRGSAQLSVTSEPAGARVLVDTLELGTTPLSDAQVPPGEYALRVEHPYSQAHRERIVVARGDKLALSVALVPGVGSLSLVSNPRGAAVTIDGESRSDVTPLTVKNLTAGLHDVRFVLPNRRVVKEQVEVLPDQTTKLAVDIERLPMGELTVTATPRDARVEVFAVVDGEQAEQAIDYSAGMKLAAQDYLVRVSRDGYGAREQRFLVKRGKNSIAVDLQQFMATLQVNVEPKNAQISVSTARRTFIYDGPVKLPVGQITVRAKHQGYRSQSKRLTLEPVGSNLSFALKKYNVSVGRVFRDSLKSGGEGPQLVVLDAGSFRMGDLSGEGAADARPAHNVQLSEPFALGVFEVSNAQFQKRTGGSGDNRPVVNIRRKQVNEYLRWLSSETGAVYRLPSEAEWEYAARSGSSKAYGATDSLQELCRFANVADNSLTRLYPQWQVAPCDDGAKRFADIGSYAANAFGLYDMTGNASEMMADCWHASYKGAPTSGAAWGRKCSVWVARGGAWDNAGDELRVSHRERVQTKGGELGFRVVREL